jgi:hypothetical protein
VNRGTSILCQGGVVHCALCDWPRRRVGPQEGAPVGILAAQKAVDLAQARPIDPDKLE